VLLFANPFSGSGPNRTWVEAFANQLTQAGLIAAVHWEPGRRREVLRAAADALGSNAPPPWILAAGGDGSVAAVLNDMAAADVLHWPFATLPVGNENLFAGHLGIDRRKIKGLLGALATARTRSLDLGVLEAGDDPQTARRFCLMASVGFDADVVHRLDRWRQSGPAVPDAPGESPTLRRVSLLSYLPRMAGALCRYAYPAVTLTPRDGTHAGQPIVGRHLFVFNLPEYGKDLGLCRRARGDDGRLDFVVFTRPGRARLLNYLRAAAMAGRHLHRADVIHGRATAFTLTTDADTPVPLQADGDPAGHVTAGSATAIRIEPSALNVVRV
jgi:diacylglycerol kinase family enzyme